MKTLLIDNYDSFTYNLYHLIHSVFGSVDVFRNDEIELNKVREYDAIFISPGPGRPGVRRDVGITLEVILNFPDKPIFGVCLGHQAIGYVYDSKITYAKNIMHGKFSYIYHNGESIFSGLPIFRGGRYHSLVIDKNSITGELKILAESEDGEIMSIKHRKYPHYGVQFHPESILTEFGKEIMLNFLGEVK